MFEKYHTDSQKVLTLAESLAFSYSELEVDELHLFVAFLKSNETELAQLLRINGTKVLPFEAMIKRKKKNDINETPFYLEYSKELQIVLEKSEEISLSKKEQKVSSLSLSLALISSNTKNMNEILSMLKISKESIIENLNKAYRKSSELDAIMDLHRLGTKPLDPLVGRDEEIDELVKALRRRNKANAILVGEPGVGKTHIVEHLAKMIEDGKIKELADKKIYEMDLASTVGGTKYRGEFEEKIKKILKKVIDDGHTILFIDEIHNIVKAGGAEGAIDCANILKPYLTRGEISIIGATTLVEYEKVFSEDKALKRRFQLVKVRPNTKEETIEILKQISSCYSDYYKVKIPFDLLERIVDLTAIYAPNESFPDKAIDVLENACLESIETMNENDITNTIEKLYKVEVKHSPQSKRVIEEISKEIIGQTDALKHLENYLNIIGISDKNISKPLGVLMFIGPSGVGKTETAKSLARHYFKNELSFLKLDMANYQEPFSLSRLTGSSPGYIGYRELSPLVKHLKTNPHSLILLDEVEKCSKEVLDFFLNIFDEGHFIDSCGQKINVNNTLFILTSNYSFDRAHQFSRRLGNDVEKNSDIRKTLEEKFRYEFLARLDDIILFDKLDKNAQEQIVINMLDKYDVSLENQFEMAHEIMSDIELSEIEKYGARALNKKTRERIFRSENDTKKAPSYGA